MALPDSRNTDYSGGSPPPIAGKDLDDVQDGVVDLTRGQCGRDFVFEDDFTGDQLDRGKWQSDSGHTTFVDDSAAGACGAAQLSDNANTLKNHFSGYFNLPGDFRFYARARLSFIVGGSNVQAYVELLCNSGGPGALMLAFFVHPSVTGANWQVATNATPGPTDTGVPFNNSFVDLEFRRVSGVITCYINGNPVFTENGMAGTYNSVQIQDLVQAGAGTVTMIMDCVKLRARR